MASIVRYREFNFLNMSEYLFIWLIWVVPVYKYVSI